jgi:acetolactate synthase-1/2/3 large subunit
MVFGMSGGNTNRFFHALYGYRGIRPVLTREESLATVMAQAYGALTGVPGVAIGQSAWLLGNGGVGILEAHLGSTPMLLLGDLSEGHPYTHHSPYQAAMGGPGAWSAEQAFSAITKRTFVVRHPVEAVQQTHQAIRWATSGEAGPVAVLYHSQGLDDPLPASPLTPLYPPAAYAQATPLDHAGPDPAVVAHLRDARRPLILAGHGVIAARASAELVQLAEATGAAVGTTAAGKGAMPETHPNAVGVIGNFGQATANAMAGEADVLLVVGSKLSPSDTCFEHPALLDASRQTIIQINVEPLHVNWTVPASITLIGDARQVLASLCGHFRTTPLDARQLVHRRRDIQTFRARCGYFALPHGRSDGAVTHPQRVVAELSTVLDRDAIITCDAGENRLFMNHYFQVDGQMRFLQPAAAGGMGYAIPAALAARAVHPDRQVVAVCGDGGFAMTMLGLMTSIEERLPIVVIVLNNQMLGWVRHGQGDRPVASELGPFDHAAIARSMGADGMQVTEPEGLGAAVKSALDCPGTAVVDVLVSEQETFLDIMSPLAKERR